MTGGATHSAPEAVARALEEIAFGTVALTARALAQASQDLTVVQWRVIVVVGTAPDGASVSDVAARLGSELSPASRLVARLARRGLLTTEKSAEDRRVTRIRLTEAGRALRADVLARRRRLLLEVAGTLGDVDDAGAELLARIGDAFRPFV